MFIVNGALLSSDVLHILHCLYDHRSFVEKNSFIGSKLLANEKAQKQWKRKIR